MFFTTIVLNYENVNGWEFLQLASQSIETFPNPIPQLTNPKHMWT